MIPLKVIFLADGQLDRDRIACQAGLSSIYDAVEIRAHDVHLVDEGHTGDLVFLSLTPYGLRLGSTPPFGTEHGHRAVQHAQGTLHFHGEVHVSGSVDDVDTILLAIAVFLPEARWWQRR